MKKQAIKPAENNDYNKQIKLNNIVNAILEQSQPSSKVNSQIDALVELAIWAQKKSPESLLSILEMGIIEQIVILQGNVAIDQIKTATMLFGNCVDSGILAHYLLKIKFGNLILRNAIISFHQKGAQKNEQLIQYLANYMKMYVKHFNKQTEELFFQGERCLLAQVCCRFYNFPEQIARTTVMNIIMHIMKTVGEQSFEEKVDSRIQTFYKPWAMSLAIQFRNQLIKFNKDIGKCNSFAEIKEIILQINDKIILWEDLVVLAPHLFRQIFFKQILQPIIVGSMSNSTKLSLIFTLKFSLVMLGKMMSILKKLHLLQELGTVIFYSLSFTVEKRCLKSISLDNFNTLTLNDEQFIDPYHGQPQQQQQKIQFGEIYQFFLTVIKSKDNQFLKIVCHLLRVLFQEIKRDKKSLLYFEEKLQLGIKTNNNNFNLIVDILISQLNSMHSLNALKEISQCIITFLNSYHLQQDLKVRFVYSFQNAINQAYESLNARENIDYIIQVFQYDLKNIEQWNIETETLNKLQEMNQQLQFLSEPFSMQNIEQSPFYEIIPDTPQGTTRYKFCKFLLFRKLNSLAIENQSNVEQINLVQAYNRKLLYSDGRLLKPASVFPLPLKQPNHPCRLIDNKQDIHTLLIDDQRFFILGFIQKNQIKIIMNLKIKHLKNQVKIKNDKTVLEIYVTAYDPVKQDLFAKSSFYLKGFQLGRYYIPMRYQRIKDAEISFISRLLNKAKSQLPEVSLI